MLLCGNFSFRMWKKTQTNKIAFLMSKMTVQHIINFHLHLPTSRLQHKGLRALWRWLQLNGKTARQGARKLGSPLPSIASLDIVQVWKLISIQVCVCVCVLLNVEFNVALLLVYDFLCVIISTIFQQQGQCVCSQRCVYSTAVHAGGLDLVKAVIISLNSFF